MGVFSPIEDLSKRMFVVSLRLAGRVKYGTFPSAPDDVLFLESREKGRSIKAHVYNSKQGEAPRPVLINLHGSGFIFPIHGVDDFFCRRISDNTSYTTLDVSYRMAPEHPFPAALEDIEDVVAYIQRHSSLFDPNGIAISGFSAGGTLALAAASSIPRNGPSIFKSVIAFYPVTDLNKDSAAKSAPDTSGSPIPTFMLKLFNSCYVPPKHDPKDPRISPLFAPTSLFPRHVLMITCALDSLAPEAEELAGKIEAESSYTVVRHRFPAVHHSWDKDPKGDAELKARDDAYGMVEKVLSM